MFQIKQTRWWGVPLPAVLCALVAALAVLTASERLSDPDMWWHLRTGQIICSTHTIPTVDLFSYTTGQHATVPHEWLSQVIIYAAYSIGGYRGLMLWMCCATAFLLIGTYLLCWLACGDQRLAFGGALVAWVCSTVAIAVRPQMIGYNLLVVELIILELARKQNRKWLYALPAVFCVWVNCHGSFFFGFALAVLYLTRVRAFAILGLSAASMLITPDGWKQAAYPLDTLFRQSESMRIVSEWQPLSLTDPRGLVICAALVLLIWAVLAGARPRPEQMMAVAAASWLAFSHARMAVLFGIVAPAVVCQLWATRLPRSVGTKIRGFVGVPIFAGSIAIMIAAFPTSSALARQTTVGNPATAVQFVREHPPKGHLLNEYLYGGYLIWVLPQQKVFIDGRADVFDWTGVLREYDDWRSLRSDTETLLRKYDVGACLLLRGSPIAKRLSKLPNWRVVLNDGDAVLYYHM